MLANNIHRDDWLSEIIGLDAYWMTGDLRLPGNSIDLQGSSFLQHRTQSRDAEVAKQLGFFELEEILFRYTLKLSEDSEFQVPGGSSCFEIASQRDLRDIVDLGRSELVHSRFRADGSVPRIWHDKILAAWFSGDIQRSRMAIARDPETRSVVGFMSLRSKRDNDFQIGHIAVLPQSRGNGYGIGLIQFWQSRLGISVQSTQHFFARTQATNTGSRKFYEKCGFEEVSREFVYQKLIAL